VGLGAASDFHTIVEDHLTFPMKEKKNHPCPAVPLPQYFMEEEKKGENNFISVN